MPSFLRAQGRLKRKLWARVTMPVEKTVSWRAAGQRKENMAVTQGKTMRSTLRVVFPIVLPASPPF